MERKNQRGSVELRQFFSDTRTLIEEQLFPLAQKCRNEEAMESLCQAWLRLKQGPIRVLFLGVSSAGKSTLINAMTGRIVVPEGRHTTSPVPVWIHSSESALKTPDIRIIREADRDELPEVSNAGGSTFISNYCYTPKEASSDTAREKYKGLIAACVDVLFQSAPNSGLTLIDAPGINAAVGDNLRVEDILHQGCEMVIIVFQGMTQSDKDYLRRLLVDDDGLLYPLLESGRVFAVHNYVTPGTKADAEAHLRDLFGEALPRSCCYMVNAHRCRLKVAGIYDYLYFLQEGATDEENQEAKAGYQNEEKLLEKLKGGSLSRDIDRLWADLQTRGRQLMDTPEERDALIAPIRRSVNRAIGLLERGYNREIKNILKSDQGINQEYLHQCHALQVQLEKIREAEEYAAKAFDDTDENSISTECRKEVQAFFPQTLSYMRKQPELQGRYLICGKDLDANKVLLERIEERSWASALVYGLLSQRASNMHTTFLYKLLGEEFQEKVLSPLVLSFQRSIQKVGQILEEIDASISPKQKVFLEPEAHIVSLHRQASLLASQSFQLSLDTETANTLMEYLLDKQARINSGRLLSHISRAFLNVNLEVDHLDPYVRSRLEGSMAIYTETMGESLKNSIADLEMGLQDALESKQRELQKQISVLEKRIKTEQEAWQQKKIRMIEQHRWQLHALRLD